MLLLHSFWISRLLISSKLSTPLSNNNFYCWHTHTHFAVGWPTHFSNLQRLLQHLRQRVDGDHSESSSNRWHQSSVSSNEMSLDLLSINMPKNLFLSFLWHVDAHRGCTKITDNGLLVLAEHCPMLSRINIRLNLSLSLLLLLNQTDARSSSVTALK